MVTFLRGNTESSGKLIRVVVEVAIRQSCRRPSEGTELIASSEIGSDFMNVGQYADELRTRLLDTLATATPTDDDAGKCLARLVASLNAMPASVLLQIALADDLLEGRVVPVVEAAIGMAAAGLTEYRDAGELLYMFADLADAVRSRTLN
jgi:hypothetical protein